MELKLVISLVLCMFLRLVTVQVRASFGVYDDPVSGKKKYYRPLTCTVRNLYNAKWYRANNERTISYTDRRDRDCCYDVTTRNQCCQYLHKVSGGKVEARCKCDRSVLCGQCPQGWKFYPAKSLCLLYVSKAMSNAEATAQCREQFSSIPAEITDQAMSDFITSFVVRDLVIDLSVWIGIGVNEETKETYLSSNKAAATYTRWEAGYPSSPSAAECIRLVLTAGGWKWKNERCDQEYHIVCQLNAA